MTKGKMIEVLIRAIECTADAESIMDEIRKRDGKLNGLETIAEYNIASVIYALETELSDIEAKKSGSKNKLSVMKSILKSSKRLNPGKPVFHNCTIIEGYQVAIDGYRALFSKETMSGLGNNKVNIDVSEENIKSAVKLATDIIGKINDSNTEITICDYKLIENEYRILKAAAKKKKIVVVINDEYVYNVEYLIDGLKAINTEKIYVTNRKTISAMKNDNGDAYAIMPIFYKNNIEEIKEDCICISIHNGKIVKDFDGEQILSAKNH